MIGVVCRCCYLQVWSAPQLRHVCDLDSGFHAVDSFSFHACIQDCVQFLTWGVLLGSLSVAAVKFRDHFHGDMGFNPAFVSQVLAMHLDFFAEYSA